MLTVEAVAMEAVVVNDFSVEPLAVSSPASSVPPSSVASAVGASLAYSAQPRSRMSSSRAAGEARGGWAIFWFAARRRFRNAARAIRATPAAAETTPTTMGIESEPDCCSGGGDTGPLVEVVPKEGAGVHITSSAAGSGADVTDNDSSVPTVAEGVGTSSSVSTEVGRR